MKKKKTSGVDADVIGETAKKKGTAKGKGATASHLEQTYRPGNANYRIQKVIVNQASCRTSVPGRFATCNPNALFGVEERLVLLRAFV